jgi:hypothetical protein
MEPATTLNAPAESQSCDISGRQDILITIKGSFRSIEPELEPISSHGKQRLYCATTWAVQGLDRLVSRLDATGDSYQAGKLPPSICYLRAKSLLQQKDINAATFWKCVACDGDLPGRGRDRWVDHDRPSIRTSRGKHHSQRQRDLTNLFELRLHVHVFPPFGVDT